MQDIRTIIDAFRDGLGAVLGPKLAAAYVYGASAFPGAAPTGDIDFHVLLEDRLTDAERAALAQLHEDLARQYPPLGGELDGYYLLLADAGGAAPPRSEMWDGATDHSWALHRAHCRAGRCIVLHGPDPRAIYPPPSWPELEAALCGELDYVAQHVHDYPDYCILNLCRLVYSFETGEVVISKAEAAAWALEALPRWRRHVGLALKSYAQQATPGERGFMLAEAPRMLADARERIAAARAS